MKAQPLILRPAPDSATHFFVAAVTRCGAVAQIEAPFLITFNVNGVDLPFAETLDNIYERLGRQVDERQEIINVRIKQAARAIVDEMLRAGPLGRIVADLGHLEAQIQDAVHKMTQDLP